MGKRMGANPRITYACKYDRDPRERRARWWRSEKAEGQRLKAALKRVLFK